MDSMADNAIDGAVKGEMYRLGRLLLMPRSKPLDEAEKEFQDELRIALFRNIAALMIRVGVYRWVLPDVTGEIMRDLVIECKYAVGVPRLDSVDTVVQGMTVGWRYKMANIQGVMVHPELMANPDPQFSLR